MLVVYREQNMVVDALANIGVNLKHFHFIKNVGLLNKVVEGLIKLDA
jgi:hypothetical protein